MALNAEDFQRIQTSLLELKNENYALEDQCRKQKNALGEAQAKVNVFEKELSNAQKVIAKSKKTQEVQQILKDNESLQHKLLCQEEEFRLQNQTLLEELSKLVTTNETLESKIRHLNEANEDEIAQGLREEISSLQSSHRDQLKATQKENDALRSENCRLSHSNPNEYGVVQVDAQGVSFKKQNSVSIPASPSQIEGTSSNVNQLEETISALKEENLHLKQQATSEGVHEENQISWKSKCLALQEQLAQNQEKLRKKQDSYLQLQEEKEASLTDYKQRLEKLRSEKDQEIFNLREQSQRLQVQLNHGHSGFSEFKEKKAKEIEELKNTIEAFSLKANDSADPERLEFVEKQVQNLQQELNTVKDEKAQILQENADLLAKSIDETEVNSLKLQLEETNKMSESRKSLLEEMKEHIEKKTSDCEDLQKQTVQLKTAIQEKEIEIEGFKEDINHTRSQDKCLRDRINEMEAKEADLQMEFDQIKTRYESEIQTIKEGFEDDIKIIKMENEISRRDLSMQLEISNAQKNEFEETIEHLNQEIKDQNEERKIGDKKGQALIKDLKKQLLSEKQRSEKLSEKMKEHFDPPSNFSEVSKADVEPDRTSNSSWSIYSGQNDCLNYPPTPFSTTSRAEPNSNEPSPSPEEIRSSSLPMANATNADYGALLDKISHLEENKFLLEQRLQMLETSNAGMVDDLTRKSNLIKHYCMEGKNDPVKKEKAESNVKTNERIKNVRKVMDLLVHPDQVDAQKKEELQRMQRMLEETLTKNMHLQNDLEHLSQEVVRLSKLVPGPN